MPTSWPSAAAPCRWLPTSTSSRSTRRRAGPREGTPPAGVRLFRDLLVARGVNATIRRNRGTDIDAACGQLAAVLTAPADT